MIVTDWFIRLTERNGNRYYETNALDWGLPRLIVRRLLRGDRLTIRPAPWLVAKRVAKRNDR